MQLNVLVLQLSRHRSRRCGAGAELHDSVGAVSGAELRVDAAMHFYKQIRKTKYYTRLTMVDIS